MNLLRTLLVFSLALGSAAAQRLSPLATPPDWTQLEAYQETITRAEFERLLGHVYAPGDAARGFVVVEEDGAVIQTTLTPRAEMRLRFAKEGAPVKAGPRFWRPAAQLAPAPAGQPLAGVKIALDPGHLGGAWAKMEERWFQIGESRPIVEGELTLRVAKLLAPQLRALGAEVSLVRTDAEPVTPDRPETLRPSAREELARGGFAAPRENYDTPGNPLRGSTVQAQSELLFYRISEIRRRAQIVNTQLRPDLVVCLHFNAEAWGEPARPELVPRNHLHILVNGSYSAGELRFDDQRFEMLRKLLSGAFSAELAASERVATALASATKLPPYQYTTGNAIRVGTGPFVWARNLLANRLYEAPVVFLEPYVMNSEIVWARVQAGDYEGELLLGGEWRRSIFREYADAVAAGLREHFATARPVAPVQPVVPK